MTLVTSAIAFAKRERLPTPVLATFALDKGLRVILLIVYFSAPGCSRARLMLFTLLSRERVLGMPALLEGPVRGRAELVLSGLP